jgi:hypothetical protein
VPLETSAIVRHTPGPWSAHYSRTDPYDEWIIGGEGFVPVIAFVIRDEESNPDGATVEANARLITAAPELLATLKDVIAHLRSITLDPGDEEDDAPALVAAEALIARAEGRK